MRVYLYKLHKLHQRYFLWFIKILVRTRWESKNKDSHQDWKLLQCGWGKEEKKELRRKKEKKKRTLNNTYIEWQRVSPTPPQPKWWLIDDCGGIQNKFSKYPNTETGCSVVCTRILQATQQACAHGSGVRSTNLLTTAVCSIQTLQWFISYIFI